MGSEELLALAERCEKARGPDRELDAEIQVRISHPEYRFPDPVLNRTPTSWREACGRFRHDGFGGEHPWPAYTASIDAAASLSEAKYTYVESVGPRWQVKLGRADRYGAFGFGATEPLARCAAALRARAALTQEKKVNDGK